ncbi:ATP-grasp domain-containing protein [Kribbella albertanoniae]|nr:ATP-grasp domain-containing protein [Kribbella albertanoniae]
MRSGAFGLWRRMGLEVILVDGTSASQYQELADSYIALDPRDGTAAYERIKDLAAGCDGVTTLADGSQQLVAEIAAELGLPGSGVQAAAAARSKAVQRELCEQAGMVTPRWRTVRSERDLQEFFGDRKIDAVLKPTDATGGSGVLAVSTVAAALREWPIVRTLSRQRIGVVEELVEGREVCVEAVLSQGEPVAVSITEAEHGVGPGFVCTAGRVASVQPDHAIASAQAAQLGAVLGLSDGILHAEFKVGPSGWTLLETAVRPGGALVPDMTRLATGTDLYRAQALQALGQDPRAATGAPTAPYAQVRYLVATGRVRRFVPPAEVLDGLPDVLLLCQQGHPGQQLRSPLSDGGRAGYALGCGDDPERLDEQLRTALTRLCAGMGLTVVDRASAQE